MLLHLFALVVLGLMCGSELNVALFGHPVLTRQPLETHILVRSSLAALLGKVMPFWMGGSTLLNLLLLLSFEQLNRAAWRFAAIAFAIQALAVLFSLVGPVPINNRIAKWTPKSLPENWSAQEHRWDMYHFFRTWGLLWHSHLLRSVFMRAERASRQRMARMVNRFTNSGPFNSGL